VLRGRLEDLLGAAEHAEHEQSWLAVTLTDPRRPADAMRRLRRRFPHTLVVAFEPERSRDDQVDVLPRVTGRSDLQVAESFVAEVRGEPADAAELALLRRACDGCAGEGAA
jgi:exonuclease SbcD